MKFLIDANLPYKLANLLKNKGYNIIHTDDLPNKEKTKDDELRNISINDNRIIITKDTDFLDSHIIKNIPPKLLLITTGNITNDKLFELINSNFETIISIFETNNLIELNNDQIVIHEN